MAARKQSPRKQAPEICPVCGEDVPPRALACPECGADEKSGWREDAENLDGLELPDDDFDYERFVQEEFARSPKPAGINRVWWITAIVILFALVAVYFYAG
ncbi:MAG: zinc ribbon domain-containing protein [Verrucomicrobiota bacterium]|nr:zinc ribbon domain-containing protein [Verrucomicrobiota bacterium]